MELPPLSEQHIYKVLRDYEWRQAQELGRKWHGSVHDVRDGFIHNSRAGQLAGVLQRFFAGESHLWLVTLDPVKLGDALVDEPASNGELYPHIYGGWQPDAVVSVQRL